MKKLTFLILGVLFVGATFFLVSSYGAENAQTNGYSYGTVRSVSSGQIVVTEYDYDNDEETDVTYALNQNTAFQNVASLTEIAVGDNVDIVYVADNGTKIVQSIAVEKMTPEDESTSEVPEAQPSGSPDSITPTQEPVQPSFSGNQTP